MAKPKPYNTKQLTKHLRELAAEAHDMLDDGTIQTKGEALATLLWQKALGYTEKSIDDEGQEKTVRHEPAAWAIQLVYDRMEGKTPQAISEDEGRITAADSVRKLAKSRLNALAQKASGGLPLKPPPTHRRKNSG